MKILVLAERFEPSVGGEERQCKLLSLALISKGEEVTVLTERYSFDLPGHEKISGIVVHRVMSLWILRKTFQRITTFLKEKGSPKLLAPEGQRAFVPSHFENKALLHRLNRILFYKIPLYVFFPFCLAALIRLRKDYDIIQVFKTNLFAVAAVIAGRITGKPVVARDAISGGMDELSEFMLSRLTSSIVSRNCTFVALSKHVESDLKERGIPESRIVRIPNAVELPSKLPLTTVLPNSVLFIGNVRGNSPQKGLDVLLNSWLQVVHTVPHATLTVVGNVESAPYERLAVSLGIDRTIRFAGVQNNISPWFERSELFVLPSRYEGMSNALLEAMSHRKACIVTQISGSDDLIQHHVNGLKVPSENVDALAKAIIYLLTHPSHAKQLGEKARQTVARYHTPEIIVEQYIKLYKRLLSK